MLAGDPNASQFCSRKTNKITAKSAQAKKLAAAESLRRNSSGRSKVHEAAGYLGELGSDSRTLSVLMLSPHKTILQMEMNSSFHGEDTDSQNRQLIPPKGLLSEFALDRLSVFGAAGDNLRGSSSVRAHRRERERERERERDRQTDRQTDRQRLRETDRERQTETERERERVFLWVS